MPFAILPSLTPARPRSPAKFGLHLRRGVVAWITTVVLATGGFVGSAAAADGFTIDESNHLGAKVRVLGERASWCAEQVSLDLIVDDQGTVRPNEITKADNLSSSLTFSLFAESAVSLIQGECPDVNTITLQPRDNNGVAIGPKGGFVAEAATKWSLHNAHSFTIARSSRLGIDVRMLGQRNSWCADKVSLQLITEEIGSFDTDEKFRNFFYRLVTLLNNECTDMDTITVQERQGPEPLMGNHADTLVAKAATDWNLQKFEAGTFNEDPQIASENVPYVERRAGGGEKPAWKLRILVDEPEESHDSSKRATHAYELATNLVDMFHIRKVETLAQAFTDSMRRTGIMSQIQRYLTIALEDGDARIRSLATLELFFYRKKLVDEATEAGRLVGIDGLRSVVGSYGLYASYARYCDAENEARDAYDDFANSELDTRTITTTRTDNWGTQTTVGTDTNLRARFRPDFDKMYASLDGLDLECDPEALEMAREAAVLAHERWSVD